MMKNGNKPLLAIQYLEDCPEIQALSAAEVRARLRDACSRLPIDIVILGWNVPPRLVDACAEETGRAGAMLFRWHPLLTGDATFSPRHEWRAIGVDGAPVPGFKGLAEFTFLCPNNPVAAGATLEHLQQGLRQGPYQGVFLDRIRFPSPAGNPALRLACFCPACQGAAA
jgi:hypothetical protein